MAAAQKYDHKAAVSRMHRQLRACGIASFHEINAAARGEVVTPDTILSRANPTGRKAFEMIFQDGTHVLFRLPLSSYLKSPGAGKTTVRGFHVIADARLEDVVRDSVLIGKKPTLTALALSKIVEQLKPWTRHVVLRGYDRKGPLTLQRLGVLEPAPFKPGSRPAGLEKDLVRFRIKNYSLLKLAIAASERSIELQRGGK